MVDIATTTVEAAATEEAIGFIEHSDSGDSELQEQVQKVKVTVSEIQKLTPQLLSAAKMATGKEESSAAVERLNLLSEEWATKVRIRAFLGIIARAKSTQLYVALSPASSYFPSMKRDGDKAM